MRTIVLLSGGIDSTVLLADRIIGGDECLALTFDYRQRSSQELKAAKEIAHTLRVRWKLALLPVLAGSALTGRGEIPTTPAATVDATYVPARNIIMLAVAAHVAERFGASAILFGANRGDHAGYPDCRPKFIAAMNEAVGLGTNTGVSVCAPFCSWSKAEIVSRGRELDAPLHLTWSCYRGDTVPCGRCGACLTREEAMACIS